MADERLNSIEKHAWKILSTLGLSAVIWYLNGINTSLKTLSDDIVAIKLQDSANSITINTLKSDVGDLKIKVGELEKSSTQHEQQLRQWNK